jgi:hypothetical protein
MEKPKCYAKHFDYMQCTEMEESFRVETNNSIESSSNANAALAWSE